MPTLKAKIGGQWVAVGGPAPDEVVVGPDDPSTTNPEAEMWYDTDAVPTVRDETALAKRVRQLESDVGWLRAQITVLQRRR